MTSDGVLCCTWDRFGAAAGYRKALGLLPQKLGYHSPMRVASYAVQAIGALLIGVAGLAVVLCTLNDLFGYVPPFGSLAAVIDSLFWWALILLPGLPGFGLWKLGEWVRERRDS